MSDELPDTILGYPVVVNDALETPAIEFAGVRIVDACDHPDFVADVSVNRIQKEEGGRVAAYTADVRVKCAKCGRPFRWIGLQAGMSYSAPMVSVDGLELRAPIVPQGQDEPLPSLPGFRIETRGMQ